MSDISKMLDDMFERDMNRIFGNCTNSFANPGPLITAETLLAQISRIHEEITKPLEPVIPGLKGDMRFGGLRIIESLHAVRRERVKIYPKRKSKSWSHWLRMDKKWQKRYGFRELPQAYVFKPNQDLRTPETLLIHPLHASLLPEPCKYTADMFGGER